MGNKKKKPSKRFIKIIDALKNEINGAKSISESLIYATREEFVQKTYDLIMKKKDTNIF